MTTGKNCMVNYSTNSRQQSARDIQLMSADLNWLVGEFTCTGVNSLCMLIYLYSIFMKKTHKYFQNMMVFIGIGIMYNYIHAAYIMMHFTVCLSYTRNRHKRHDY